jgi:hypothetical protein
LLVANDTALAESTAERFFASHFGADHFGWKGLPMVTHLECQGDCSSALATLVAAAADVSVIQVDGELSLAGPLSLGTPERPVLIVASGAVRLEGAVALHGVLHGESLHWDQADAGALVRGALLSETEYAGNGAPELIRDAAVLERLTHGSGSFARVNGAWRDF